MIGPQLFISPRPQADPRLIAANNIMQLATVELEQAVAHELDENPALELVERLICSHCGGSLRFGYCPSCSSPEIMAPFLAGSDTPVFERTSQDDFDPLMSVSAPLTLAEQLFAQLRLILDQRDHEIALYLTGNLDEHGYLTYPVEELAQDLHVGVDRVRAVLEELQRLEPVGVGAQNLTECLLMQIEQLAAQGVALPSAVRTIVRQHLEDLGHHQFERIRLALKLSREEVEEAFLGRAPLTGG